MLSFAACASRPAAQGISGTVRAPAAGTAQATLTESENRPQIFTFESDASGFNTKTFFYDNGAEVVAFDTQFTPQAAQASIDFLRTKTNHPLTLAVITHPNPDKFNGMLTFQAAGAKIVASDLTVQNMPAAQSYKQYYFVHMAHSFTDDSYPKLGKVDQVFSGKTDLILKNGERIKLQELGRPGVSTNQTVVHIPRVNALMVGDLVHHKAHAWLEGGIVLGNPTPTVDQWIQILEQLKTEYAALNPTVYGGRGEAAELQITIPEQVNYLLRAKQIVYDYVSRLGDRRAELSGPDAGAHYAALQQIFESTFPDYKLGYMIQYGVYGLVNSMNSLQK